MLEAKLLQQIAVMRQAVMYEICLDIHKAYDALDQGHALTVLERYGVVPQVF